MFLRQYHLMGDQKNTDGDWKALDKQRKVWKNSLEQEHKPSLKEFLRPDTTQVLDSSQVTRTGTAPRLERKDTSLSVSAQHYARICDAIDSGDMEAIQAVVSNLKMEGKTISHRTMCSQTTRENPLHYALNQPSISVATITYLVEQGGQRIIMPTFSVQVEGTTSQKSCVHQACERGDLDVLKKLVTTVTTGNRDQLLLFATLVKPDGQRARNLTGLHIAAKNGFTELVKFFVNECSMDVNLTNNKNDTPLLWASNDNQLETVMWLLSVPGIDVNKQNDKKSSALHWAVRNNYYQVVKALVIQGAADVNIERSLGLVCPLLLASAMGFTDIVQFLCTNGANVNKCLKGGETALYYAAGEGHSNICKILLSASSATEIADSNGDTPLLHAASQGHNYTAALLVHHGADMHHVNTSGMTPWHYAVESEDDQLLEVMLSVAASEESSAEGMKTSESTASLRNVKFHKQKSPFHIAAELGKVEKIKVLKRTGFDATEVRDAQGNTYMHIAAQHDHVEILKLCSTAEAASTNNEGDTPLLVATKFGRNDSIRELLPRSSMDLTNNDGHNVLHTAAQTHDVDAETIEALVTQSIHGYSWSHLHEPDKRGCTSLHLAVKSANSQIFHALKHLDPTRGDSDGNTPLHLAVLQEDTTVMFSLLSSFNEHHKKIDLSMPNKNGQTVLHLAGVMGNTKQILYLIEAGADLGAKDTIGNTLLHNLVMMSAEEPVISSHHSVTMFQNVLAKAVTWYSLKDRKPIPERGSQLHKAIEEIAVRKLLTKLLNNDGHTVLTLAASVGAAAILQIIFNTEGVFYFANGYETYYDVTNLIPETTATSEKTAGKEAKKRRKSRVGAYTDPIMMQAHTEKLSGLDDASEPHTESLISIIVENENISAAARVLEVVPIKNMVSRWWAAYQWFFMVGMIVHVLYMSLLSAYGVTMMNESRNYNLSLPILRGSHPGPSLFPEILVLLEPILLIAIYIYIFQYRARTDRTCCKPPAADFQWVARLTSWIWQVWGLALAFLVIAWFVAYSQRYTHQDYILSVSLIFGWVFTMQFTKGFRAVHHFSLMLHAMVFKDISKFALIYLLVLLSFGFALHAMVQSVPTQRDMFPRHVDTLFTVFNWMIGMDDFYEEGTEAYEAVGKSRGYVQVLYLTYIVLSTVVLFNLLIAMMSDSYAKVKKRSAIYWNVESVRLALEAEELVPFVSAFARFVTGRLGQRAQERVEYNKEEGIWRLRLPEKGRGMRRVVGEKEETREAMEYIERQLAGLQEKIEGMSEKLESIGREGVQPVESKYKLVRAIKKLDNRTKS